VLAINLSAAALNQVQKRGFQLSGGSSLSSLGFAVTRLLAPSNLDAVAARQLLQQEMPSESFGYNWLYRPYRSASGTDGDSASHIQSVRLADGSGCSAERCYGPALIKWQPQLAQCARNVRVGVVDTGFDHFHPTFNGRRLNVGSFVPPKSEEAPNWHGTGVLSLLSGDPHGGTPGLIPDSEFFVADAFFADAGGHPASDTFSLLNALDWMEAWNVKVVNLSLSGPKDELVHKTIQRLTTKGVLFVAAAGNDGPAAPPSYPAAYPEVIAVTAVDRNMRSYRYANRGEYIDLAAPGVAIWTAVPDRREGAQTGTSFAAPYVTAVVASTYKSLQKKTKSEVLERLETIDIGEPGRDPVYGRGLVQAPQSCSPQPQAYSVANKPVPTQSRRAEAVTQ
jgi:subtilisin family serine protease